MIPAHVGVVVVAILAITFGWVPWFLVPLLTAAIGIAFACLTFVAHEGMHGGIVRGRRAKHLIGLIGFMPFMVSPRLWAAWHDRVHHANANLTDDPDMYPTLAEYRGNSRIRFFVDAFSLGGRRWRGVLSLVLGFTVQSAHQLFVAEKRGFLSKSEHRWAYAEALLGVAVWTTLAVLVGFLPFVFGFVFPLVIANMIVMAYILTNHSLSPLVAVNDPLVTGLSVTAPRWIEWLTLSFGFHVEHHLFPAMSSRHARLVRTQLLAAWPERYQSMPWTTALSELHRTGRVYKDATTLIDPTTMIEYPVLMPRASVAA
jgi:fatty acid desaturase